MTTSTLIFLLLMAFGASFIQRVTGFGFGVFIMTVLPHIMPSYGEATALSGILAMGTVLVTSFQYRKSLKWKHLLPILLTFLLFSFIAIRTVSLIDDVSAKHVLGIILILVSLYFFFASGRIHLKPTIGVQVGMGVLSGWMGGFFAMQGPPAVIYFIAATDKKEEYIALTSMYFLVGNFAMTLFRASSGFLTPVVLKSSLCAIPAVILGLVVGHYVYKKLPIEIIRKVVYAYMAASGVLALFV